MTIMLDDESGALLRELRKGRYRSDEEAVKVALCLLRNMHARQDLDAKLSVGMAQGDGGATHDADEVFDRLEAKYASMQAAE